MYFDTILTQFGYYDGTAWIYLSAASTVNLGFTQSAANVTITNTAGTDVIIPLGDGTNAGLLDPADFTKLSFITITQAVNLDTVESQQDSLINLSGVAAASTDYGTVFTGSTIPDGANNVQAFQALETALENIIDLSLATPEAYDPSGTSAFPTTYSAGAIRAGHTFRITAAGTMDSGAVTVNSEDLLIALVDTPTDSAADWQVVESNRDQATETTTGVTRYSTNAEALAGTDDQSAMTPLKTQAAIDATTFLSTGVTIGGGAPVNIVHNLGTTRPNIAVWNTSDNSRWYVDEISVDANTISLTKNGANITVDVRVSL